MLGVHIMDGVGRRAIHLATRVLLWTLLVRLSGLDLAQAAPELNPGAQDLIRERQERLLEEQQRRLEELKTLPGKAAQPTQPTAPADTRCFPIKDIELKGADRLSASVYSSLTSASAWVSPSSTNC
jgi:hemolysin activation/secretion protein